MDSIDVLDTDERDGDGTALDDTNHGDEDGEAEMTLITGKKTATAGTNISYRVTTLLMAVRESNSTDVIYQTSLSWG